MMTTNTEGNAPMPPREAAVKDREDAIEYPPGVEALCLAVAGWPTCHPSPVELADTMGLDLQEIERRVIAAYDAKLVDVWLLCPSDCDAVTLAPLGAERMGVEVIRSEFDEKYCWGPVGSSTRGVDLIRPWMPPSAEIDDEAPTLESLKPANTMEPLEALGLAEEADQARELLEAEIAATPIPMSWIEREVQAESFRNRRFALDSLPIALIALGVPWPIANGPHGECGACVGVELGPRRYCIACDGSRKPPEKPTNLPQWTGKLYAGRDPLKAIGRAGFRRNRGKRC
jgi:hypothetical protein